MTHSHNGYVFAVTQIGKRRFACGSFEPARPDAGAAYEMSMGEFIVARTYGRCRRRVEAAIDKHIREEQWKAEAQVRASDFVAGEETT